MTGSRICACGCGQPTPIAKLTNNRGYVAGKPTRFCVGHGTKGRRSPNEVIHFACGITAIVLERRNGTVMLCFINTSRYPLVKDHRWHVKERLDGTSKTIYAATASRKFGEAGIHQFLTGFQFEEVDHIDGNGLNNLDSNLRDGTGRNQQNVGLTAANTTGVKGWSANGNVLIGVGGKSTYLGWTKDPQKAREIYDAACVKYHGAFARPNRRIAA